MVSETLSRPREGNELIGVDKGDVNALNLDRLVHRKDFEVLVFDVELQLDEVGRPASERRGQVELSSVQTR